MDERSKRYVLAAAIVVFCLFSYLVAAIEWGPRLSLPQVPPDYRWPWQRPRPVPVYPVPPPVYPNQLPVQPVPTQPAPLR